MDTVKDNFLKLILLGDSGVGKTTAVLKYIGEKTQDLTPTIGAGYYRAKVEVDEKQHFVTIWDTAGQEMYRSLVPQYMRGAHAAVLMFDVTSEATYNGLDEWIQFLRSRDFESPIILFGNKIDIKKREIQSSDAALYAEKRGFMYIEGSAMTGEGINQLFFSLTEAALNYTNRLNRAQDERSKLQPSESTSDSKKKCC